MCLISLDKALIKAPWRTQRQNFHTFWSRRYKVVKSSRTSQTHLTGYYVAYQNKGLAFASPSFPQIIFPATFEVAIFWLLKSAPHVLT